MVKFRNIDEQREFINDSIMVFTKLIKHLPNEHQQAAAAFVNQHYNKWSKIFVISAEKDLSNTLIKK